MVNFSQLRNVRTPRISFQIDIQKQYGRLQSIADVSDTTRTIVLRDHRLLLSTDPYGEVQSLRTVPETQTLRIAIGTQ